MTRAWSAYDNSMNFEKLPVVSTGEMLLDLSGNGREPVSIRPIFRFRSVNVTGLNEVFVLPDGFGKGQPFEVGEGVDLVGVLL